MPPWITILHLNKVSKTIALYFMLLFYMHIIFSIVLFGWDEKSGANFLEGFGSKPNFKKMPVQYGKKKPWNSKFIN